MRMNDADHAALHIELAQARASAAWYRQMFHRAPVALMLDDASTIAALVGQLRRDGVTNIEAYLDANPAFLEHALDTITLIEPNERAIALFGATDAAELMQSVRHIWPDAPDTFRRSFVALYNGASHFTEETRVRTLDGRPIDVLFSLAFAGQGELAGASLNGMLDISDRIEAETRLRQVTADFSHAARISTLGELTTSIAHEIKQPLSAILTNAQTSLRWLDKDEPNLDKVVQLTTRIVESAQRASDIIGRIQDMAGKRQSERSLIDLNAMIRDCLAFLRHECEAKGVRVQLQLAAHLPAVQGDRVQLQQVVVNLVVNAIQAMEAAGGTPRTITVSTASGTDDSLHLRVSDSGPGIPEADMPRLFESFFSTKEAGMGIGLAICRSIIAAHGGTISAANAQAGGAVFEVMLPRRLL